MSFHSAGLPRLNFALEFSLAVSFQVGTEIDVSAEHHSDSEPEEGKNYGKLQDEKCCFNKSSEITAFIFL